MSQTVGTLIQQHPENPIQETGLLSSSNKAWTHRYEPLRNLVIHTLIQDGQVHPDYDTAFLPLDNDDAVRLQMPASPPNKRAYRFEVEADIELWFHSEISSVVLAGWSEFPVVVHSSHIKPLSEQNIPEEVDATYAIRLSGHRTPLIIGEIKRNLITAEAWQRGLTASSGPVQSRLSQELRGYAHKYGCPQVFCFDGATLLLLQFRAMDPSQMERKDCPVDCWVIPRTSGAPFRLALYRLLVQGFRRFQASLASTSTDFAPDFRQFYDGRPLWRLGHHLQPHHPQGYQRSVDAASGSLIWTHPESGHVICESPPIWG